MSFPYEDFVQHIQTIKDYVDNKTPELPGSFPVTTEVIDVNLSAFDFTRTDLSSKDTKHTCSLTTLNNDGLGCWTGLKIEDNDDETHSNDVYPIRQQIIALSGNHSPILLTLTNNHDSNTTKICCQYANNTEGGVQYIDKDSGLLLYLSTDISTGLSTYDSQPAVYNPDIIQIYLPQDCKYNWTDWKVTELEYSLGVANNGYKNEHLQMSATWQSEITISSQLPFSAVIVPDLVTTSYIKTNKVTFDTKIETGKITIITIGQLMPKFYGKLYITQTDKFGKCLIDLGSSYYKKVNGLPLSQSILDEYNKQTPNTGYIVIDKDLYKPVTFNNQTTYIDKRLEVSRYNSPIYAYDYEALDIPLFTLNDLFGTSGSVKVRLNGVGGLPISNNNRIAHIIDYIPLCKLSVALYTDSQGKTESSTIELTRDAMVDSDLADVFGDALRWRYDKVIKENNILYNTESSTYTLTFTKNGTVSFLYQDDYSGSSYHQNSIKISKNGTDLVTGYAPLSYTEFSQSVSAGDTILITASKVNSQAQFYIKDITFSEPDGMTQENNETAPWQVKSELQSFYIFYRNGMCGYYNEIEELKDLYIGSISITDSTTIMNKVGVYEYPVDINISIPSIYTISANLSEGYIIDCGIWDNRSLTNCAYILQRTAKQIDTNYNNSSYIIPYSITINNSDIPNVSVDVPQPIVSGNSIKIVDKDYLTAYNGGLIVKPIVGVNIATPPAIKGQFTLQLNLSWGTNKSSSLMTVSPPIGDRTIEFTGFPVFNVAKPFIEYYKDIGYTVTGTAQTFIPLIISDLLMSEAGELNNSEWGYLPITDDYNNAFINLGHDANTGIVLGELVSKNPFTLTVSVYSIPSQTDRYTGTLLKDSWHTYTFKGETITDVYGSSTTDYLDYTQRVAVNDIIDISYNSGGNYGSGERKGYINNLVFTPDDTSKIGTDCMVITNSDTTHPWIVNSDGTITVEIDETNYSTHYNIKFTAPGTVSLQYKCGGYGYIRIERTTADVTVWAADIKKAPTTGSDDNVMDIDNPYYFGICDSELTINYPYEIYMDTLQETDGSYTLRAIYTGETKPDKDMDYELLCRTNTRVYTSQNKVQLKVNNNYNWFADAVTAVFGEQ